MQLQKELKSNPAVKKCGFQEGHCEKDVKSKMAENK